MVCYDSTIHIHGSLNRPRSLFWLSNSHRPNPRARRFSLQPAHPLPRSTTTRFLSAKHGLLDLEQEIEPYEQTLNKMSAEEVRQWVVGFLNKLGKEAQSKLHIWIRSGISPDGECCLSAYHKNISPMFVQIIFIIPIILDCPGKPQYFSLHRHYSSRIIGILHFNRIMKPVFVVLFIPD